MQLNIALPEPVELMSERRQRLQRAHDLRVRHAVHADVVHRDQLRRLDGPGFASGHGSIMVDLLVIGGPILTRHDGVLGIVEDELVAPVREFENLGGEALAVDGWDAVVVGIG